MFGMNLIGIYSYTCQADYEQKRRELEDKFKPIILRAIQEAWKLCEEQDSPVFHRLSEKILQLRKQIQDQTVLLIDYDNLKRQLKFNEQEKADAYKLGYRTAIKDCTPKEEMPT